MKLPTILPLATLALLAACGDGADRGGDVTGSWRQVPSSRAPSTPVAQRSTWRFGDGGTFELHQDAAPTQAGTWSVDGEQLTIDLGPIPPGPQPTAEVRRWTRTYAVDGDHLLQGLLEPVGDVDGMIGTWRTDGVFDGWTVANGYVRRADGTAAFDAVFPLSSTAAAGTWTQSPTDVTFSAANAPGWDPSTFEMTHMKMPGSGLVGHSLFERVE